MYEFTSESPLQFASPPRILEEQKVYYPFTCSTDHPVSARPSIHPPIYLPSFSCELPRVFYFGIVEFGKSN